VEAYLSAEPLLSKGCRIVVCFALVAYMASQSQMDRLMQNDDLINTYKQATTSYEWSGFYQSTGSYFYRALWRAWGDQDVGWPTSGVCV
jgi:hypothetical protein